MYSFETQIRVRYGETDQMGYLYYGNYAQYYEVGRVETMRSLGTSYKQMEDAGILMPVIELKSNYYKPAFYDDLLIVKTIIPHLPGIKVVFQYEIFNENKDLLNKGETTLVFIDKSRQKPVAPPPYITEALKTYFK